VTRWSTEAEKIFGWTAVEVLGRLLSSLNLVFEEDVPVVDKTMARLSSGKERTVVSTNRNRTKTGEIILCTWYNSVLLDSTGAMTSVMSLVLDITERKRLEDALRASNEALELRVQKRTADLRRANEALQEEIRERIRAAEALRRREEEYRLLTETSDDFILVHDSEGRILLTNRSVQKACGWGEGVFLKMNIGDVIAPEFREATRERERQRGDGNGFISRYETAFISAEGKRIFVDVSSSLLAGGVREGSVLITARDVTERKAEEERNQVVNSLLALFAQKDSSKEYLDSVVDVIHTSTGCDALGIRITDDQKDIPYNTSVGFSTDFLCLENRLSLESDSCMCMHAISQVFEKEESGFLTSGGSIRCEDLSDFIRQLPEASKSRYRGTCAKFGFEAVAVVPIRYREMVLGAFHLADSRKGFFTQASVGFLESISPLVGEAIFRFQTEAELARHRDHLESLVGQRTAELTKANERLQIEIGERAEVQAVLRETRDYLDSLLNYANAPIIVWDPQFRITRFNHAAERLTGRTADEVMGQHLEILFPQASRDRSMNLIHGAVAGEQWEAEEIPILNRDATIRTVLWNSATIFAPDTKAVVATIAQGQDITRRKQAEEALSQKTDALARSNAELEQFAYVASHDLQEPLRMVSSYVQLLADRYKGKIDADADDFIHFAVDGSMRMQTLINDLLTYSRVGTREKKFENVSLESVLRHVTEVLKISIEKNAATLTHDPLPVVYGDEGRLMQLFQNLIENGIKFHGVRPPRIHVSASLEGNEYFCAVRDNGIGIDRDYVEKVFALFVRLHSRKEYPGTGIGLAVCRRIVEQHGGRIWIESTPGEGSTFFFTLSTESRKD
jgi:PAS domain S-box-containing protein